MDQDRDITPPPACTREPLVVRWSTLFAAVLLGVGMLGLALGLFEMQSRGAGLARAAPPSGAASSVLAKVALLGEPRPAVVARADL